MIWKICFAMSLIFLAAGAVMFIYKRYHGKGGVRYLGGGGFPVCSIHLLSGHASD